MQERCIGRFTRIQTVSSNQGDVQLRDRLTAREKGDTRKARKGDRLPTFKLVSIARSTSSETFHERPQRCRCIRTDQAVNVISHQAVAEDPDATLLFELAKACEVVLLVATVRKDHLPVVTSLNDVVGITGNDE